MSEVRTATILLVDDNRTALSLRKLMLESHGHNVMAMENALPALFTLRTELISLVILDYFLDGMTGTELAGQMRQFKPRVPILLLSGAVEIVDGSENVDCCLSKLESFAIIEDKIAELLRRSASSAAGRSGTPPSYPQFIRSSEIICAAFTTQKLAKALSRTKHKSMIPAAKGSCPNE